MEMTEKELEYHNKYCDEDTLCPFCQYESDKR